MTECERFVKNGLFAPEFFREEVLCGFVVTEKRKKLWAIQIDLYRKFSEICDRHGLRYFAVSGTILGAMRHKGYIPWDDDLDVGMPRDDYETLAGLSHEFNEAYFLQIPGKDAEYCYALTKVRNSRTAQVSKAFAHRHFNQGVCIDVFPMDVWNYDQGRQDYWRMNELNIDNSNYMRQDYPSPDPDMQARIRAWSGRSPHENLKEIRDLSTQFKDDPSADRLTIPSCTIYPYDRFVFKKSWFDSLVTVPFENIEMKVPVNYEEILSMQYGDWRQFPPFEQRGSWHGNVLIDPDRPYQTVIDEFLGRHPWQT